jgi:23S rRNA (cytosine1962-C5)-methyltransferase
MVTVVLKRGRAKPLWHGHPWVLSEAIARTDGEPADGEVVAVADHEGRVIGRGLYSGRSQLRVRLLAGPDEEVDSQLFRARLGEALALRREVLGLPRPGTDGFRWVHGEGDRLPGLVVDAFGDCLVVQFLSAGMKGRENEILDLLEALARPRAIAEVVSPEVQRLEGITARTRVARGSPPEGPWIIHEDGLEFACDPLGGQKTGFYFDQRENRQAVARLARGRRVLDGYSYTGAFACHAARAGAARVVAVEASERACGLARENARRNRLEVEVVNEDLALYLRESARADERFDLVILDPPKFAPRAETTGDALRAYRAVNAAALLLLEDGILASASCSQRVGEAELGRALTEAAKEVGRSLQVLEVRSQAPDHPWPAAAPESRYLTMFICWVRRAAGRSV